MLFLVFALDALITKYANAVSKGYISIHTNGNKQERQDGGKRTHKMYYLSGVPTWHGKALMRFFQLLKDNGYGVVSWNGRSAFPGLDGEFVSLRKCTKSACIDASP